MSVARPAPTDGPVPARPTPSVGWARFKRLLPPVLGILAVLSVATVPDVLTTEGGRVVFQPAAMFEDLWGYLSRLVTGDAFLYREALGAERSFLAQAQARFTWSLTYLLPAGMLALTLGLGLGLSITAGRRDSFREALTAVAVVPDFVLALLLQLTEVFIFKTTGFRMARVVSLNAGEPAVLLPLLTLTLVPFISVLRTVSTRAYLAAGEDHALLAKSLGLSRGRIYRRWIAPITISYLSADAARLAAMMLGNLFIVEYLFNIQGVTTFLFARGMLHGYQYDLVANGLLLTIALYLTLYAALHAFLRLLREAVTRT